MSWRLLLYDPGLRRGLPFVVGLWAIAMLIRIDLGGPVSGAGRSLGQLGGAHVALGFMFWCLFLWGITAASFWRRSSLLALTLPVSARSLWAVRTAITVAIGATGVAATTLAFALQLSLRPLTVTTDSWALSLGALAAGTLLLVIFVLQLPFREVYAIPISLEYVVCMVLVGFLGFVYFMALPPKPFTIFLPVAVAVFLAFRIFRSLPPSFEVVIDTSPPSFETPSAEVRPATPANTIEVFSEPSARPKSVWVVHSTGRTVLHATMIRILVGFWLNWIYLPGLLLMAVALAKDYYTGGNSLAWLTLSSLWVFASFHNAVARTGKLAHLPISRRLLFRYATLPWVVALATGLALYHGCTAMSPDRPALIHVRDRAVVTPPALWEISWDGQAANVVAPWGESHHPTALAIIPGLTAVLYDPFEIGPDSSENFAALQLAHALHAAHGLAIGEPLPELPGPAASRRERRDGVAVPASRGRASEMQSKTIALGALILVIIGGAFIAFTLSQYSSSAWRDLYRRIALVFVSLLVVGLAAAFVSQATGGSFAAVLGTTPHVLVRLAAERLPISPTLLWALATAAAIAAYFLVEQAYQRTEMSLQPGQEDLFEEM